MAVTSHGTKRERTICALYAHYMRTICALYAHYMRTICALYAFLCEKRWYGPVCKPVQAESEIAYAEGRVKPLARAPTLRYGPTGDSVPRLRLKASGMAEREPFGPASTARKSTPRCPFGRIAIYGY